MIVDMIVGGYAEEDQKCAISEGRWFSYLEYGDGCMTEGVQ